MIFNETKLAGIYIIEPEKKTDDRGFFARTYCKMAFGERDMCTDFVQCNTSFNNVKGLLRGMHWQEQPHAEAKLVRCTRGVIFDVMVDIRADSPTFGQWVSRELSQDNRTMLYIPEGFAHGFQTLTDKAEVFYQISAYYHSKTARGFRWDDPEVDIDWPLPVSLISQRDENFPLLREVER